MDFISSMPVNQKKELISRSYLEVIAGRTGYKTTKPDPDNGVNLSFTFPLEYRHPDGAHKIIDADKCIDFQLKATPDKSIIYSETFFSYDLEAKNYNDLIFRHGGLTPLVLIVFILPQEESLWVDVATEEIVDKSS